MSGRNTSSGPSDQDFIVGCDHAGFELKEQIKQFLAGTGNRVRDLVEQFRPRIDFPPVAERVARAVLAEPGSYGILVCGTGIGMSMAANKVPGIRAALIYSEAVAEYSRRHNNANVLVFGGRTMDFEQVRRFIEIFFAHNPEGGKYAERNDYLKEIESRGCA